MAEDIHAYYNYICMHLCQFVHQLHTHNLIADDIIHYFVMCACILEENPHKDTRFVVGLLPYYSRETEHWYPFKVDRCMLSD